MCWVTTSNNDFTIKMTYDLLCAPPMRNPRETPFKSYWKVKAPHRVKTFMRKALNYGLMTNVERSMRGFMTSNMCPLCSKNPESLLHILRYCSRVALVCNWLRNRCLVTQFFSLNQNAWFRKNLLADFAMATWVVWRIRNVVVFQTLS